MGLDENMMAYMKASTGKLGKASGVPKAATAGQEMQTATQQSALQQQNQQIEANKIAQQQQADTQQQQFQQQQSQVGQQRQLGFDQLNQSSQLQMSQITNKYNNNMNSLASKYGMTKDNLLTQFTQNKQLIDDERTKIDLEVYAQSLALADQKYVSELQQEGQLRRLYDNNQYELEIQNMVNGFNTEQLEQQFGFNLSLLEDESAFTEHLSSMNIDELLALAKFEAQGQAAGQIVNGTGKVVSSVVDYGVKKYDKEQAVNDKYYSAER